MTAIAETGHWLALSLPSGSGADIAKMPETPPVDASVDRDEAHRGGMLGTLNMLLQFASVLVGGYIAFRHRLWNGAGLVFGVQIWHWLVHRISNGLMWLHRSNMSEAEQRLVLLRKDLYGLARAAPPAWICISRVCGWVFLAGTSTAIWWSLDHLS